MTSRRALLRASAFAAVSGFLLGDHVGRGAAGDAGDRPENPFVGATFYRNVDYVAQVNAAAERHPGALGKQMKQVAKHATFLWLDNVTYIRDPNGLPGNWKTPHYDPAATLPTKAQNRGYKSGGATLWIVPGGDAYLVYDDHVERWPRLDPLIGCA